MLATLAFIKTYLHLHVQGGPSFGPPCTFYPLFRVRRSKVWTALHALFLRMVLSRERSALDAPRFGAGESEKGKKAPLVPLSGVGGALSGMDSVIKGL